MSKVDIIIPTYQPGEKFLRLIEMLEKQTADIHKIIIMNTEEKYFQKLIYGTNFMEQHKKLTVHHLSKREFDHGSTRNKGVQYSDADIFICMTDDAVPENEYLVEKLLQGLDTEGAAIAYARQLAGKDSSDVEQYVRQFNYPGESCIKSEADVDKLGIKAYFCSNVCAAYNRRIFDRQGGFARRTIFNEDMIYAAGAIRAGYKIAYCAEAKVIHSHHYSNKQQFARNFDLGVSQAQHPEIFKGVPSESEGIRMVCQTASYLLKNGKIKQIPSFIVNSGFKFLGYQMGKHYTMLPIGLVMRFSMNKQYWNRI